MANRGKAKFRTRGSQGGIQHEGNAARVLLSSDFGHECRGGVGRPLKSSTGKKPKGLLLQADMGRIVFNVKDGK